MPADLNPPQLDAVRTLRGPLLVLAGAGTGKTRVVTYRIAELIRRGTKPERILAVTFTKKAAGEMQERAGELLAREGVAAAPRRDSESRRDAATRPEISTFHSLCVRILRRHIERLGYPQKFVICDRNEQESQARAALRELRAPNAALCAGRSAWRSSAAGRRPRCGPSRRPTSRRRRPRASGRRRRTAAIRTISSGSARSISTTCCCSPKSCLRKFPAVRTCRSQAVRSCAHRRVSGHEPQPVSDRQGARRRASQPVRRGRRRSIDLRLARAEVTHILRSSKDWPEAKIVRLEDNYRSTAAILRLRQHADRLQSPAARKGAEGGPARRHAAGHPAVPGRNAGSGARRRRHPAADRRRARPSRATSPSCAARTSSRGRSKPSCGGRMCRTC